MTDQAAPPNTPGPPRTRQELYERIRETSKEEFILDEMIRLGFWPPDREKPEGPASEIRRSAELTSELNAVRTELSRLQNQEAMLRALRKKRMAEALEKRKETKKRREEERKQRADAWQKVKDSDITYLGEGVSYGLKNRSGDSKRLESANLPCLNTAAEIAEAMSIPVNELRFLTFTRNVSKKTHYTRFYMTKKSGGQRLISAPMPRLKEVQTWLLENILEKIPVHHAAHGFLKERSIVTNATPHMGKAVVVNLDLKDFFPTLTYKRVKGLFRALGYSEQASIIFALLCTEPEVDEVELDNETYYVTKGDRHLPQGAPSSPMLTNIICRRLDKRLEKLAQSLGFVYTRYADDITFSGPQESRDNVGKLLAKTRNIVEHEGFTVHPDKTRVLGKGRRQEVTGIVVNDRLSVNRKSLRRLRATLFQLEKDGINGKHWGSCPDVIASVQGYAYFVYMVDPAKGSALLERISRIRENLKYRQPEYKRYPKRTPSWKEKDKPETAGTSSTAPTAGPAENGSPQQPKTDDESKPWWKFW